MNKGAKQKDTYMKAINRNIKRIFTFAFAAFLLASNAMAQEKNIHKGKADKKRAAIRKNAVEDNAATLNTKYYLSAIAKITVVDSIVTDKENFLKNIPLSSDCGRIAKSSEIANDAQQHISYAYINGYGDIRYFSKQANDGTTKLYRQEKIGGTWNKEKLVTELNEKIQDIDFPYLLSDGVTLYFSGISKDNGFGKRDIFMARLDTDSMTFYKPENIGLPYNSKANDYMCIIDDINNLGWLVTDRRQPQGKVCIYTFIPSDERWDVDETGGNTNLLNELAEICCIKATQKDVTAINEAKARLSKINIEAVANEYRAGFPFIVSDNRVYHSIEDFRSETNKKLFLQLSAMKQEHNNKVENLTKQRMGYSISGHPTKAEANKIAETEAAAEKMELDIKILEKKIRNAENLL